jgi:hypothetical protein
MRVLAATAATASTVRGQVAAVDFTAVAEASGQLIATAPVSAQVMQPAAVPASQQPPAGPVDSWKEALASRDEVILIFSSPL